jgi:hypothetical protein
VVAGLGVVVVVVVVVVEVVVVEASVICGTSTVVVCGLTC